MPKIFRIQSAAQKTEITEAAKIPIFKTNSINTLKILSAAIEANENDGAILQMAKVKHQKFLYFKTASKANVSDKKSKIQIQQSRADAQSTLKNILLDYENKFSTAIDNPKKELLSSLKTTLSDENRVVTMGEIREPLKKLAKVDIRKAHLSPVKTSSQKTLTAYNQFIKISIENNQEKGLVIDHVFPKDIGFTVKRKEKILADMVRLLAKKIECPEKKWEALIKQCGTEENIKKFVKYWIDFREYEKNQAVKYPNMPVSKSAILPWAEMMDGLCIELGKVFVMNNVVEARIATPLTLSGVKKPRREATPASPMVMRERNRKQLVKSNSEINVKFSKKISNDIPTPVTSNANNIHRTQSLSNLQVNNENIESNSLRKILSPNIPRTASGELRAEIEFNEMLAQRAADRVKDAQKKLENLYSIKKEGNINTATVEDSQRISGRFAEVSKQINNASVLEQQSNESTSLGRQIFNSVSQPSLSQPRTAAQHHLSTYASSSLVESSSAEESSIPVEASNAKENVGYYMNSNNFLGDESDDLNELANLNINDKRFDSERTPEKPDPELRTDLGLSRRKQTNVVLPSEVTTVTTVTTTRTVSQKLLASQSSPSITNAINNSINNRN